MKRTPLYPIHKILGARFTEFAGWKLPLSYSSTTEEVRAVREEVGVFDVSHMGRLLVEGEDVKEKLQFLTTNNLNKLRKGKVQYTLLTNERGGIKDDVTLYMLSENKYMICCNAVNKEKVIFWLSRYLKVREIAELPVQIAVQGKKSEEILSEYFDVRGMKFYTFRSFGEIIVSRTGYTGEKGYEIYAPEKEGRELFEALVEKAIPCGLGARDILRIEAGYPLYGNELSENITPLEANLDRFVDLSKEFIGKKEILEKPVKRKLFGLELLERGVPRKGYKILKNDREVGVVSSGTFSPTLGKGIALCFVDTEERKEGNEVFLEVRGRKLKALLRSYPFI